MRVRPETVQLVGGLLAAGVFVQVVGLSGAADFLGVAWSAWMGGYAASFIDFEVFDNGD